MDDVERAADLTIKLWRTERAAAQIRAERDDCFRALRGRLTVSEISRQVTERVVDANVDPSRLGVGRDSVRRAWAQTTN